MCIISFALSGAAVAVAIVAVVVIIEKCHLATTLVATIIIASVLLMVRTRIISETTKKRTETMNCVNFIEKLPFKKIDKLKFEIKI